MASLCISVCPQAAAPARDSHLERGSEKISLAARNCQRLILTVVNRRFHSEPPQRLRCECNRDITTVTTIVNAPGWSTTHKY
jgi:hypothetical protein